MKSSDSKKLLKTWHKRNGTKENAISRKDTAKFFPRSSGFVISLCIKAVAYIEINSKKKLFIPVSIEYTPDASALVYMSDPAKADIETSTIRGNRRLFLMEFTDLFSESIVSQAFTGSVRMFFTLIIRKSFTIKNQFLNAVKIKEIYVILLY
jgi:hypothetical protein